MPMRWWRAATTRWTRWARVSLGRGLHPAGKEEGPNGGWGDAGLLAEVGARTLTFPTPTPPSPAPKGISASGPDSTHPWCLPRGDAAAAAGGEPKDEGGEGQQGDLQATPRALPHSPCPFGLDHPSWGPLGPQLVVFSCTDGSGVTQELVILQLWWWVMGGLLAIDSSRIRQWGHSQTRNCQCLAYCAAQALGLGS